MRVKLVLLQTPADILYKQLLTLVAQSSHRKNIDTLTRTSVTGRLNIQDGPQKWQDDFDNHYQGLNLRR